MSQKNHAVSIAGGAGIEENSGGTSALGLRDSDFRGLGFSITNGFSVSKVSSSGLSPLKRFTAELPRFQGKCIGQRQGSVSP
jgi:hypothetical protein